MQAFSIHFLFLSYSSNGGANLPQNCMAVTFRLLTDLERKTYSKKRRCFVVRV